MKKNGILVAFCLLIFFNLNAETLTTNEAINENEITFDSATAFSLESESNKEEPLKKHYITAISSMLLDNALLSSWNRFVSRASWAKVNYNDVTHFYEHEMKWDTDWYWTNFVLHPYQGSLYYMGARASNLNPLESFAVTLAGSSMWEWFCERNAPSKNDMIYTTFGAFAVGEMLYRLSIEADEVSRLFGYALSPERMYTEFVSRERAHGTTGNIQDFSLKFSIGTTRAYTTFSEGFGDDTEVFPGFVSPEVNIVYNDPYGWDSNSSYSQFEFIMGGAIGFGSGEGKNDSDGKIMYDVFIQTNGMLFSRSPNWGENNDTTIGIVFDYDFIWHSFMELSSLAPGFAIKQRINRQNGSKVEWQLHLDALICGTTDYYYYRRSKVVTPDYTFCDYNYTIGNETVLKLKWTSKGGCIIDTDFHGYAMYVFEDQLQPGLTTGWEFVGIETINAEVPVSEKVNIGIGNQIYLKKTVYSDIPDIFQAVYTGSVFARLKIK